MHYLSCADHGLEAYAHHTYRKKQTEEDKNQKGPNNEMRVVYTFERILPPYLCGTSQCRRGDKERGRRADVGRRSR